MTTGEKIRSIRKSKGITAKQLGEKCGMFEGAILRVEKATKYPRQDTLTKIAAALNVPVEELYPDKSPNTVAENFNEILRQHIIKCVKDLDDRKALLDIASNVEGVLKDLAEEERKKEIEHDD